MKIRKPLLCLLTLCLVLSLCACAAEKSVTFSPLPATVDVEKLENCTLAAAFTLGDASGGEISLTVYDYELFDLVDISKLKAGDSIILSGEALLIESLERNERGDVIINGGLDKGGRELATDESGVYFESGYNDAKTYRELGVVTLPLAPDFVFTDASDPDKPPATHTAEALSAESGLMPYFSPSNTRVIIENGLVTAMERRYIP